MPFNPAEIIALIDLTSLNDDDTDADIIQLCNDAQTPSGNVAAVCVYPQFVTLAKQQLANTNIKVATVVNFPKGEGDIQQMTSECAKAIEFGADEIDVVMPYQKLLAGDSQFVLEFLHAARNACNNKCLKVIIESGALQSDALIHKASELCINAGVDFVKTSTGKIDIGATPQAAEVILHTISDLRAQNNIGIKLSGGIRTIEQANSYLELTQNLLSKPWINNQHFRIGASSLLKNILKFHTQ